jgi:hypothetical protein
MASIPFERPPVLSLRTPEVISAARVKGFTSENVARFFDVYESEVRRVNHQAHRIFNADETRIIKVQHWHSKVVSLRGKKKVASLTLAGGNLITLYLYCPYRCVIPDSRRYILSNTTLRILIKTHYIGDMFRLHRSHLQAYVNVRTNTDYCTWV